MVECVKAHDMYFNSRGVRTIVELQGTDAHLHCMIAVLYRNCGHCRKIRMFGVGELPIEDYETLSSMDLQLKYFDFVMNKDGPYRSFEDLWDEPKPKDQA